MRCVISSFFLCLWSFLCVCVCCHVFFKSTNPKHFSVWCRSSQNQKQKMRTVFFLLTGPNDSFLLGPMSFSIFKILFVKLKFEIVWPLALDQRVLQWGDRQAITACNKKCRYTLHAARLGAGCTSAPTQNRQRLVSQSRCASPLSPIRSKNFIFQHIQACFRVISNETTTTLQNKTWKWSSDLNILLQTLADMKRACHANFNQTNKQNMMVVVPAMLFCFQILPNWMKQISILETHLNRSYTLLNFISQNIKTFFRSNYNTTTMLQDETWKLVSLKNEVRTGTLNSFLSVVKYVWFSEFNLGAAGSTQKSGEERANRIFSVDLEPAHVASNIIYVFQTNRAFIKFIVANTRGGASVFYRGDGCWLEHSSHPNFMSPKYQRTVFFFESWWISVLDIFTFEDNFTFSNFLSGFFSSSIVRIEKKRKSYGKIQKYN